MKTYTLDRERWIPLPLARVFPFFERPENLALLTPPSLRFTVLTPSPVPMHAGSAIEYTIRIAGFPLHWKTRILSYDPPRGFVDEQSRGPYKLWRHTHGFTEIDGRTRMTDHVEYALGWGLAGSIAHALYVRRTVEGIFNYRNEAIDRLLKDGRFG